MYRKERRRIGRGRAFIWRAHQLFNALFESSALPLHRAARLVAAASRARADGIHGTFSIGVAGPGLAGRRGFLPRLSIPARCGCTRAVRPARASKRPRCGSPRIEREIRDVIPPDEIEMLIDNIGIPNSWPAIAQGDIPTISSADGEILISLNKEKHGSDARLRSAAAEAAAREIPGHDLLLPAGQHHQPDPELRPSRAHRFAGGRPERGRQLQNRAEAGRREFRAFPGAADVHVHQVVDQPADPPERRSREGVATGSDAARRHQQHADLSQRQRHGGAELLDELGQRRQLQRRRADAAIPDRFAGRAAAHADLGRRQRR